jgi:hypothetical protein
VLLRYKTDLYGLARIRNVGIYECSTIFSPALPNHFDKTFDRVGMAFQDGHISLRVSVPLRYKTDLYGLARIRNVGI